MLKFQPFSMKGGVIHPRTYLYKEGDECSDLTGGWSDSGWTWQGQTVSGTVTKNTNDITVVGKAWLGTQSTINLSDYKTLVVDCEVNNTSCGLCVNTTKYIAGAGTKFVQPMTAKTVVDISTVTTNQYIGFGSYNSNTTVKVKNVWLE